MPKKFPVSEQRRIAEILERLEEEYPDATCALHHENAYQLLVATILSAQCTDERVNQVTPELFRRFPDAKSLAAADPTELEELIRSTGFYRNKAKSLLGCCRRLVEAYGGEVPDRMEDLLTLPGVARKTANVVLGTWFGMPEGIVVDTHVSRIARRLGLADSDDRDRIETELMEKIPREQWIAFAHRLIHHGRRVCKARRPACEKCRLLDLCPYGQEQGKAAAAK
ncbi:MAG: endonuclease III [Acidobacteriota bacterium]